MSAVAPVEGGSLRGRLRARIVAGSLFASVVVILAFVAVWPVYRTPWLFVTAGGGVAAAVVIATFARLRALSLWTTAGALLVAFLLLGVPLAIPGRLSDLGALPQAFGELAAGLAVGGKDLVTVDLPVGTYRNLLVPAFALFLVGTCALLLLAWRRDRIAYAAVPVAIGMTAFGLVFGSSVVSDPLAVGPFEIPAPVETVLGALTLLACLLWLVWRGNDERVRALAHAAESSGVRLPRRRSATDRRRGALAAGMIAVAVLASALVVPFAAQGVTRDVLRGAAGPDIALSSAVSPLSGYRALFADDRAEDVLFTVASDGALPERVRLATLDSYDGAVFRTGDDGAVDDSRFVRVPSSLDAGEGERTSLTITIDSLEGIWMPTVGRLSAIGFEGARAAALADGFYYNRTAWAGVETAGGGLAAGDVLHIEAVVPDQPELTEIAAPGGTRNSVAVPDALTAWVDEHRSGTGGTALAGLVSLLRERGYLSHGLDDAQASVWMQALPDYTFQPSASGHSLARVQTMFARLLEREADPRAEASGIYVAAIGDDEQFAVATALIARELGFPSRVVLGTRLSSSDPGVAVCEAGVCRAEDVGVWAEVQSADGTWIPVDATPQYAESPSLVVTEARDPENVTDVRPDTVQEVVPPDSLQEDTGARDDTGAADRLDLAWLWSGLRVAGVGLLLLLVALGPFIAVVIAKAQRRRTRRRAPTPAARIVGGWDEYLDAALDAGRTPPRHLTRSELARHIGSAGGEALAAGADRAVFGGAGSTDEESREYWRLVEDERRGIRRELSFWRRVRMTVSLTSFVRPLARTGAVRSNSERGKRALARAARTAS